MNSLVFGDEKTSWEIQLLRKYGWNRSCAVFLTLYFGEQSERFSLTA